MNSRSPARSLRRAVVAFSLCIAALPGCTNAGSVDSASKSVSAQLLLDKALAADAGPGMQAAVIKDGKLVFSGVAGFSDLEGGIRMTANTRMRIGSVSKIITSALALKQIDKGALDPDIDVGALVAEFPSASGAGRPAITPRMLASHSSGIRHYDFGTMSEANNQVHYDELADALALFARDDLVSAPGTAFHYSSFGFNLLGVAAARSAGTDFASAVRQVVCEPLDLGDTQVDDALSVIPRRARFYTILSGNLINTYWRDSSDYYPSGGMLSSAVDLARLARALFGDDFLGEETSKLMLTEVDSATGPTGYSFGWKVVADADGTVHYEHGGETNGAYGWIFYDPENKLIISGATNYNIFPNESEAAFFGQAMEGLRELYSDE